MILQKVCGSCKRIRTDVKIHHINNYYIDYTQLIIISSAACFVPRHFEQIKGLGNDTGIVLTLIQNLK
jgi:hypothetical protein